MIRKKKKGVLVYAFLNKNKLKKSKCKRLITFSGPTNSDFDLLVRFFFTCPYDIYILIFF